MVRILYIELKWILTVFGQYLDNSCDYIRSSGIFLGDNARTLILWILWIMMIITLGTLVMGKLYQVTGI